MIMLIEPDATVRKKLCDMLHRERIITVKEKSKSLRLWSSIVTT